MAEEVEIPIQRCLYRQSSVETRLTPEPPPASSDEECEEETKNNEAPKVIGLVLKEKKEADENAKRKVFQSELNKTLANRLQKPHVNFEKPEPSKPEPKVVFREYPKSKNVDTQQRCSGQFYKKEKKINEKDKRRFSASGMYVYKKCFSTY